jgi:hypothetical protein
MCASTGQVSTILISIYIIVTYYKLKVKVKMPVLEQKRVNDIDTTYFNSQRRR